MFVILRNPSGNILKCGYGAIAGGKKNGSPNTAAVDDDKNPHP
jgi:hypothetical protein